ncbi:hypothetical protein [Streptomyces sp. NPDC126503]|uniref:hypothetical protein n=1 Tax=Streptomyces sp. NPDC126503 TaxID=3155315 RepID=UPI00331A0CD6
MTRHTPVTPTRNALTCNVTGRTRPRHTPYAKNIPIWKEPTTDSPRTTYHPTRADYTALTQTIQPGDHLYADHDGHTREWIVTSDTAALTKSPLLTPVGHPPDTGPRIPLHQLLARCGAITTQPPTERTPT